MESEQNINLNSQISRIMFDAREKLNNLDIQYNVILTNNDCIFNYTKNSEPVELTFTINVSKTNE